MISSRDNRNQKNLTFFRQNLLFPTSTVSIFAISEGLSPAASWICVKKCVVFRLEIENHMNLWFKNVKNVIYWACRGVSFWLKIVSRNCPNVAKNEFFALKMYVFRPKISQFLLLKCQFFVQRLKIKGISQKSSKKMNFWLWINVDCQFFKIGVWKLFKNHPKFLNFGLRNVTFSSENCKLELKGISLKNRQKMEFFAL